MLPVPLLAQLLTVYLVALVAADDPIVSFDASYVWSLGNSDSHEHMQLLAALGGLVNRDSPKLFIPTTDTDRQWFDRLTAPGAWLGNRTVEVESDLTALVQRFYAEGYFSGAVLYDGGVPSSSNVASTLAGMLDLLPLLSGGVLQGLLCEAETGPQLPVQEDLVGRFDGSLTGSRKNDAYEWFRREYMGPGRRGEVNARGKGKLNAAVQGYFMDYWWALNSPADVDKLNVAVLNADWVVAQRGLLWDLDVWEDTVPNDDPTAPAPGLDLAMLMRLLSASYEMLGGEQMIHVAGFVPWAFKYITDDPDHGGVPTEWQAVKVLSAYNAYVDADACCELNTFGNAAFYRHYPGPASGGANYAQNPAPTEADLMEKGYLDANGHVVPKKLHQLLRW